jgi:uncharacterized membrane protein
LWARLFRRAKWGILGFVVGVLSSLAVAFLTWAALPAQISGAAASTFFATSTGVSATILVAMAVSSISILRRVREEPRTRRVFLISLLAEMIIIFVGMVRSAIAVLVYNPTTPFNQGDVVYAILFVVLTWMTGFGIMCFSLAAPGSTETEHDA